MYSEICWRPVTDSYDVPVSWSMYCWYTVAWCPCRNTTYSQSDWTQSDRTSLADIYYTEVLPHLPGDSVTPSTGNEYKFKLLHAVVHFIYIDLQADDDSEWTQAFAATSSILSGIICWKNTQLNSASKTDIEQDRKASRKALKPALVSWKYLVFNIYVTITDWLCNVSLHYQNIRLSHKTNVDF